jgi:hypothetical protein
LPLRCLFLSLPIFVFWESFCIFVHDPFQKLREVNLSRFRCIPNAKALDYSGKTVNLI